MAAFVLTMIVEGNSSGQEVAQQGNLIAICLEQLSDTHHLLRQWLALCLGKVLVLLQLLAHCLILFSMLRLNLKTGTSIGIDEAVPLVSEPLLVGTMKRTADGMDV